MRLSIDVSSDQHKQLKMIAAMQGKSIKDYVLECTLPAPTESEQSLSDLETFLSSRIQAAKQNKVSSKSVEDIFQQVLDKDNQS